MTENQRRILDIMRDGGSLQHGPLSGKILVFSSRLDATSFQLTEQEISKLLDYGDMLICTGDQRRTNLAIGLQNFWKEDLFVETYTLLDI